MIRVFVADNIIHYEYPVHWTWEDLYNALETSERYTHGQPYIATIHDMRACPQVPTSTSRHLQYLASWFEPSPQMSVLVSDNPYIKLIAALLDRLSNANQRYLFVATMEEAYAAIQCWRQALD